MSKQVNILEHELVPKHEVLPPEEALKVLKELGVQPWQLPWISANDPVVKAIGAKPGDIIKIIRKSPTAGVSVAYRYVVVEVTKRS
ncbi:MAG: DNA-directed RNA polymerase subunit H [Desulfurococcaceae archaeon]|jgi:DNA-directed RNA polymerase subunit H